MNITLTPEQESLIRAKIATGKYQSPQQLLEVAFRLLEEYEQAENEWVLSVREKIQAAIDVSEQEPPIDGEVNQYSQMLPHPINQLSGKIKAFQGVNALAWQEQIRGEWDET